MKKALPIALSLMLSSSLFAHDVKMGGIYYKMIEGQKVLLVTYKSNDKYRYEDRYTGHVIIPNTVRLSGFNYIVTGIYDGAFEYCNGLTAVTLPPSLTEIGHNAFEECKALTRVHFAPGLRKISWSAFNHCTALDSVILPGSVTTIGDWAFSDCSSIKSFTIPDSVISIGSSAFESCVRLKSVSLPDGLTKIGSGAFKECKSLTSISVPHLITTIEGKTFSNCHSLTSVTLPDSLSKIMYNAFEYCTALSDIRIPDSVTSIGARAFCFCRSLPSITIPEQMDEIGSGVFSGCISLKAIDVHKNNTHFSSREGVLFNYAKDSLIQYPSGRTETEYFVPNGVMGIHPEAFAVCIFLTSITLPNSVTEIGENAFLNCKNLKEIRVPNRSLGRFKAMESLKGFNVVGYDDERTPQLTYVEQSIKLEELNPNQLIEANETCTLSFRVTNMGKCEAVNCQAIVHGSGNMEGITVSNVQLPPIPTNATQTVEIPISTNTQTVDGSVTFTIHMKVPNGFSMAPVTYEAKTHAYVTPDVKIIDHTINKTSATSVQKLTPFELSILLQNTSKGFAKDVSIGITIPAGVSLFDGEQQVSFPIIAGGELKTLTYQLIISSKFAEPVLPIQFIMKDGNGNIADNKTISLNIDTIGSMFIQPIVTTVVNSNTIDSIAVITPFAQVPMSSVLASFNNEFSSFEMRERDDSFPYTLFRVRLQGAGNKVRLAKQTLQLHLGQFSQTEKTVTSYENQILFLIPKRARTIYLTCGDGCEQQLIFSGQLEANKIYEGVVEVK